MLGSPGVVALIAGALLGSGALATPQTASGALPDGVATQLESPRDFDVPPKLVTWIVPEYPKAAREKGISGVVQLRATIDREGRVRRVRVVRSISELDAAAVAAVKRWRYAPALRSGGPVKASIIIAINFRPPSPPKPISTRS